MFRKEKKKVIVSGADNRASVDTDHRLLQADCKTIAVHVERTAPANPWTGAGVPR